MSRTSLLPHQAAIKATVQLLGQVSKEQLDAMFFAHTSPRSAGRQARRTLAGLVSGGHIARVPRAASSEGYYYIPVGSEARNVDLHAIDVSSVYVRLYQEQARGNCRIREFETEQIIRGTRTEADAYLWAETNRLRDFYIEVDRGSHKRPKTQQKIRTYQKAYERASDNFPAVLYIVTDDPLKSVDDRVKQLREWIRQVPHETGLFTVCSLEDAISLLLN